MLKTSQHACLLDQSARCQIWPVGLVAGVHLTAIHAGMVGHDMCNRTAGKRQHHGVCHTCETRGLFLSRVASWSLAATEWVSPPLSLPRCMLLRSSDNCPTTEPWPLLVLSGEKYFWAPPTPALPATDGGPDTGSGAVEAGRHGCCVQSVCGAGRACIMTVDWRTAEPCMARVGQQQTSAHYQARGWALTTAAITAYACCVMRGSQL
jgi:hypothetical protein